MYIVRIGGEIGLATYHPSRAEALTYTTDIFQVA